MSSVKANKPNGVSAVLSSLKRCFKSGIINPNGKMKRALKQQRSKVCTNRYRRRVFATNIFSAMQMCARQSMNQIATSK